MIKEFTKYNENINYSKLESIKLRDLWEIVKDELDRMELLSSFINKKFKNKLLSFTTKKGDFIDKIKIINTQLRIFYNYKGNLVLASDFIDENKNKYEISGGKEIIIWRITITSPEDPYGEEDWD